MNEHIINDIEKRRKNENSAKKSIEKTKNEKKS